MGDEDLQLSELEEEEEEIPRPQLKVMRAILLVPKQSKFPKPQEMLKIWRRFTIFQSKCLRCSGDPLWKFRNFSS